MGDNAVADLTARAGALTKDVAGIAAESVEFSAEGGKLYVAAGSDGLGMVSPLVKSYEY